MDVIRLLKKDHQDVSRMFERAQASAGRRMPPSLVDRICRELEAHTQVEEELFYPAVRETGDAELRRLVDESLREHQRVKQQIQALRGQKGDDATMATTLQTMAQDVEHHVTEEEGEMFPRVTEEMEGRQLQELGRRVQERKQALMGGRAPARERGQKARAKRAAGSKRAASARAQKREPARKRKPARTKKASPRAKTARGRKTAARGRSRRR